MPEDTNNRISNNMMGMFGSIKSFAEKTLEVTKSAVIRFWNTEAVQSMKNALSNIVSSIGGHINEVLGPLKEMFDMTFGVVKSIALFGIMIGKSIKDLFFPKKDSAAEEQEEQTSWLGKIWNALMHPKKDKSEFREGIGKDGKKTGWLSKILIGATVLLVGFFTGIFESFGIWGERIKIAISNIKIPKFLKNIGKWKPFRRISEFFIKIKDKLKAIKLPKKGILGILGKLGKLIGKVFFPIIMLWEAYKGWQLGDTFWEKVMGASGGIISVLLSLPEMLINAILKPFTDFRMDFSTEAIFEGLQKVKTWILEKITIPIGDFFTKTLPNAIEGLGMFMEDAKQWIFKNVTIPIGDFFTKTIPELWGKIKDIFMKPINDIIAFFTKERGTDESILKDIIQKAKDVFSAIKQWLIDAIPSPMKILKSLGSSIKGFFSDDETTEPLKNGHKVSGKIVDNRSDLIQQNAESNVISKEQTYILKSLLEEMKKSNSERQKQTSSINSAISINSKTENNNISEPVDNIDNMGILFQNSTLG